MQLLTVRAPRKLKTLDVATVTKGAWLSERSNCGCSQNKKDRLRMTNLFFCPWNSGTCRIKPHLLLPKQTGLKSSRLPLWSRIMCDVSIIKVFCVVHFCWITTHEPTFTSDIRLLLLCVAGQLVTHSFVQSCWYLEQRENSLPMKLHLKNRQPFQFNLHLFFHSNLYKEVCDSIFRTILCNSICLCNNKLNAKAQTDTSNNVSLKPIKQILC